LQSNSIIISMKKIALFFLLFSMGRAYAQQPNDYNTNRPDNYNNTRVNKSSNNRVNNYGANRVNSSTSKVMSDEGVNQIRIVDTSQEIRADILPFKTDPKIKNDRYYFWYLNNVIHSTQGGYNGQLLNGHYIAFYPDKNLKEEGNFKRGLKDGEWKIWNPKGDLTGVANWNEGIEVPESGQPFWKKMPFFKKKDDQQQNTKTGEGN
jgi:antitoxin component YwqK of YwqJK toxin-antitoxin module